MLRWDFLFRFQIPLTPFLKRETERCSQASEISSKNSNLILASCVQRQISLTGRSNESSSLMLSSPYENENQLHIKGSDGRYLPIVRSRLSQKRERGSCSSSGVHTQSQRSLSSIRQNIISSLLHIRVHFRRIVDFSDLDLSLEPIRIWNENEKKKSTGKKKICISLIFRDDISILISFYVQEKNSYFCSIFRLFCTLRYRHHSDHYVSDGILLLISIIIPPSSDEYKPHACREMREGMYNGVCSYMWKGW